MATRKPFRDAGSAWLRSHHSHSANICLFTALFWVLCCNRVAGLIWFATGSVYKTPDDCHEVCSTQSDADHLGIEMVAINGGDAAQALCYPGLDDALSNYGTQFGHHAAGDTSSPSLTCNYFDGVVITSKPFSDGYRCGCGVAPADARYSWGSLSECLGKGFPYHLKVCKDPANPAYGMGWILSGSRLAAAATTVVRGLLGRSPVSTVPVMAQMLPNNMPSVASGSVGPAADPMAFDTCMTAKGPVTTNFQYLCYKLLAPCPSKPANPPHPGEELASWPADGCANLYDGRLCLGTCSDGTIVYAICNNGAWSNVVNHCPLNATTVVSCNSQPQSPPAASWPSTCVPTPDGGTCDGQCSNGRTISARCNKGLWSVTRSCAVPPTGLSLWREVLLRYKPLNNNPVQHPLHPYEDDCDDACFEAGSLWLKTWMVAIHGGPVQTLCYSALDEFAGTQFGHRLEDNDPLDWMPCTYHTITKELNASFSVSHGNGYWCACALGHPTVEARYFWGTYDACLANGFPDVLDVPALCRGAASSEYPMAMGWVMEAAGTTTAAAGSSQGLADRGVATSVIVKHMLPANKLRVRQGGVGPAVAPMAADACMTAKGMTYDFDFLCFKRLAPCVDKPPNPPHPGQEMASWTDSCGGQDTEICLATCSDGAQVVAICNNGVWSVSSDNCPSATGTSCHDLPDSPAGASWLSTCVGTPDGGSCPGQCPDGTTITAVCMEGSWSGPDSCAASEPDCGSLTQKYCAACGVTNGWRLSCVAPGGQDCTSGSAKPRRCESLSPTGRRADGCPDYWYIGNERYNYRQTYNKLPTGDGAECQAAGCTGALPATPPGALPWSTSCMGQTSCSTQCDTAAGYSAGTVTVHCNTLYKVWDTPSGTCSKPTEPDCGSLSQMYCASCGVTNGWRLSCVAPGGQDCTSGSAKPRRCESLSPTGRRADGCPDYWYIGNERYNYRQTYNTLPTGDGAECKAAGCTGALPATPPGALPWSTSCMGQTSCSTQCDTAAGYSAGTVTVQCNTLYKIWDTPSSTCSKPTEPDCGSLSQKYCAACGVNGYRLCCVAPGGQDCTSSSAKPRLCESLSPTGRRPDGCPDYWYIGSDLYNYRETYNTLPTGNGSECQAEGCTGALPNTPPGALPWSTSCMGQTSCSTLCDIAAGYSAGTVSILCNTLYKIWDTPSGSCNKPTACTSLPTAAEPVNSLGWPQSCKNMPEGSNCTAACNNGFVGIPQTPTTICTNGNWTQTVQGQCNQAGWVPSGLPQQPQILPCGVARGASYVACCSNMTCTRRITGCTADIQLDTDLRGSDLYLPTGNGQKVAALGSCCTLCSKTTNCTAFTWDSKSTACWLKSDAWTAVPYPGAVSGSVVATVATKGCSLSPVSPVCDSSSGITFQNKCLAQKAGVLISSLAAGCCSSGQTFCNKTMYLQGGFVTDQTITQYGDAVYMGALDARASLLSNVTTLQMQPPRTLLVSAGGHLYVSKQQLSPSESFRGLYTWNGTGLIETQPTGELTPDSVVAKHRRMIDVNYAVFDFDPPYPFSLVVRVSITHPDGRCKGLGTGALIAANLVITAAHVCLEDSSGGPGIEVEPGVHLDNTVAETPIYPGDQRIRVRSYQTHPGYEGCLEKKNFECSSHDICLMTLDVDYQWPDGVPASDRLYFGIGAQCDVSVHSWMSAGYPGREPLYYHSRRNATIKVPEPIARFHVCDQKVAQHFVKLNQGYCQAAAVCSATRRVVFDNPENCPLYGGQSGSPMWMQDGRQRYIECVYITSNGEEPSSNVFGVSSACVSLSGPNLAWLVAAAPNAARARSIDVTCRRASADLQVFASPSVRSAFLGTVRTGSTFLWIHPPTQFEGLDRLMGLEKGCWLYVFATTVEDSRGQLVAGQGMIKVGIVDANDVCGGRTGRYNVVHC